MEKSFLPNRLSATPPQGPRSLVQKGFLGGCLLSPRKPASEPRIGKSSHEQVEIGFREPNRRKKLFLNVFKDLAQNDFLNEIKHLAETAPEIGSNTQTDPRPQLNVQ
jgi:hypothetical protein